MFKRLSLGSRRAGQVVLLIVLLLNCMSFFIPNMSLFINIVVTMFLVFSLYTITVVKEKKGTNETVASSVLKMSEAILKVDRQNDLYSKVLEEIISNVKSADRGSLITIDEHGDLDFEAVIGFDLKAAKSLNMKFEDTYFFRAIDKDIPKSVVIKEIGHENQNVLNEKEMLTMKAVGIDAIKATVCVPITLNKKLYGIINIDSTTATDFAKSDVELIEQFSYEVSKVIRLYKMFEMSLSESKCDPLTGVLNRKAFKIDVNEVFKTESDFGDRVIVYYDLDQFKLINDQYGHEVGDRYMKHFVKGIQSHLTGEELFSRFGGDEFVLLYLRSDNSYNTFRDLCQNWFIDHPFSYKGNIIKMNYCEGRAVHKKDALKLDRLIQLADERMTIEKQKKRK